MMIDEALLVYTTKNEICSRKLKGGRGQTVQGKRLLSASKNQ